MKKQPTLVLSDIAKIINSGKKEDIDFLMSLLTDKSEIGTIKLIDFALSQIKTKEGFNQIKFYLFNGTKIQRSYASLYFKRHGYDDIILEALLQDCIDEKQAFSI
jgi:hypothetical protein